MLAFAGPLALYLATLSPGVDFWDIGEMQTVPYVLGIAHPTGFPLFVLLAWAFGGVVPFGTPAWRVSLLCALATAGAAYLLYVFVRDATRDAPIAVAAAFAFAAGAVVWTRAVRADVHDVALLATVCALVAAARAGATRSPRALAVAAVAYGCGLATHPIAALALPSGLLFAWPALAAATAAVHARTLALAVAPLGLYAYIPLRSAYVERRLLDPGYELGLTGTAIFDEGAPSSPAGFLRYVSGAEFHPLTALGNAFTDIGIARTAAFVHDIAYREYGYATLAFALVGIVYLLRVQPRLGLGLALLPLAGAAFAANYVAESDIARYALSGLWAASACAGIGVWWLATALAGPGVRAMHAARTLAAVALIAALLPGVVTAARDVGHAQVVDDARALGPDIVRYTVDGSLLVASWNYATPLAYERYVAHSLGTRRLACGWPHDFSGRYDAWRARYKHVYFVLARGYDVTGFARPLFAAGRWQLSELRS